VLSVAGSIGSRSGRGGTARVSVEVQLEEVRAGIEAVSAWAAGPRLVDGTLLG